MPNWLIACIPGIPALLLAIVATAKLRPDLRKLRTDQAAALIAASSGYAVVVTTDSADLRKRIVELEKREDLRDERDRARDRMLITHHQWDVQVWSEARQRGLNIPAPPPLWSEEASTNVGD